ncbi:hypothetical protein L9F63_015584, partial [Diploptera punctata]
CLLDEVSHAVLMRIFDQLLLKAKVYLILITQVAVHYTPRMIMVINTQYLHRTYSLLNVCHHLFVTFLQFSQVLREIFDASFKG